MNINNTPAYELLQKESLSDLQSEGYLLRHKKSGAKIVLLENEDDNKVFTIGFRTPPINSTGLTHILEHSVLCGSRKFPSKDPFVELVKGSLNTFLNAMTYPDKTVYPVASVNEKDFQNLMDVYMDAVFYPNIYQHEEIFRQEGWSYELESPEAELKYNGVVYNEMKGAFSSPESVLDRVVLNSLFPDTSYSYESGGDPEVIPQLGYEEFLNFHKTYYHPSNSYIYLYGDMDMEEKLNWLDTEYLAAFDQIKVDSEIKEQKGFDGIKEYSMNYSIASDEPLEENTYLSYNKVIADSLDTKLYLAFEILDYALLSASGAPIKKALLEAGIGKDIMGSYDNGIRQPIFSVIAKNADEDQKEAFVKVIEDTLKNIVSEGVDQKALIAGLNYFEFRYREADFGNYPKGLMYGLQIFDSWLYDDEKPFIHVEAIPTYQFLKEQVGTRYYEELIQTYLLDNTHGSIVMVKPERGRSARMDQELEEKLKAYKESLSPEEVEQLVEKTRNLKIYQETPSTKEEVEKIPVLAREDISREIAPILNEERSVDGVPVIYHEVETNGIGYLDLLFDLSGVTEEDLVYVGILQAVLGIIDTEHYSYGELFNEINMYTGGIGTSLELYPDVTKVAEKEFKATFEVKTKALYEKLPVAFDMIEEILLRSKLVDTKRMKEILEMTKSRLQMRFQSAGHSVSVLRAQSYTSPMARFKDLTNGIDFYENICHITEHFEEEKDTIVQKLEKLCTEIFFRGNMMASFTAAPEGKESLNGKLGTLSEKLHEKPEEEHRCILHCKKRNEGLKTASKVQYVTRTGNFMDEGEAYTGALQILKVILSYEYLWQEIRVKGGAYGAMSGFNRIGEGFFTSYRDPHLNRTNEIYKGVGDYLRGFKAEERDMTKYIIGTISGIDQPMTPASKGERSMNLYMNHVSPEIIKQEREEILSATAQDIRNLAPIADKILAADQICVIGGEDKIEKEKELFDEVRMLL